MAASFLALLLVGTLFLNQEKNGANTTITNGNNVVNTTTPEVVKEDNTGNKITDESVKTQEGVATTTIGVPVKVVQIHTTATVKTIAPKSINNKTEAIAYQEGTDNNGKVANETPQQLKTSRISVNASDLLASVENPGQVKATSATVDKTKQGGVKVSANTLLSSVEGELNESFRDKVLQSVSKNFDKVKTSVASRNHE